MLSLDSSVRVLFKGRQTQHSTMCAAKQRRVGVHKYFALLAFLAMRVAAQELMSVGDLLDKGAKKLNREEVVALLNGATMSGIQRDSPEFRFTLKFREDGSVSGSALRWANNSGYVSVLGTWTVNEQGQSCRDLRNSYGNRPKGSEQCNYHFKLGESYWDAPTDNRSERAIVREVKR